MKNNDFLVDVNKFKEHVVNTHNLKNLGVVTGLFINYFNKSFDVSTIDACGNTFKGIEKMFSIKVKHECIFDCVKTVTAKVCFKFLVEDTLLAFYWMLGKCVQNECDSIVTPKIRIRLNNVDLNIHNETVCTVFDKIFYKKYNFEYKSTDICEIEILFEKIDTSLFLQIKACSVFVVKDDYKYYFEELRRQQLVEEGLISDILW